MYVGNMSPSCITYVPSLKAYKRALRTHESDELDSDFVPTIDIIAPTLEEVAIVEVEVDDVAFTKAIGSIKNI